MFYLIEQLKHPSVQMSLASVLIQTIWMLSCAETAVFSSSGSVVDDNSRANAVGGWVDRQRATVKNVACPYCYVRFAAVLPA